MYVYMYVCMYVCMYACMYVCVYACMYYARTHARSFSEIQHAASEELKVEVWDHNVGKDVLIGQLVFQMVDCISPAKDGARWYQVYFGGERSVRCVSHTVHARVCLVQARVCLLCAHVTLNTSVRVVCVCLRLVCFVYSLCIYSQQF